MAILKNRCLVLLIALMLLPAGYLLHTSSSDVSKLLFVAAMVIIVWAANEAADQEFSEGDWIDAEWSPCKDCGKKMLHCFHRSQ